MLNITELNKNLLPKLIFFMFHQNTKEKTGPGVGHILVHIEARDINPSVL